MKKYILPSCFLVLLSVIFIVHNPSSARTPLVKTDTTTAKNEMLNLSQTIPLAGVKGRIDHMAYDAVGQRIFICALGNGSVEIVDLKTNKVIHSIKNLAEPQGIVYDSIGKRIFVSSGNDGMLRVYNSENYARTDSLKIGSDADNVRYDYLTKRIYVAYDGGMAVVNADGLKMISNIELDGHPESFQMDQTTKKMYVNVPDAEEIEVINLTRNIVWEKWVMNDAKDNFPMALDEKTHHVFVACRHPSKILVMDDNSGRIVTVMECSDDADDIFYDSNSRQLIVSCGQGFIDIYKGQNDSLFHRQPRISTRLLARTSYYNSRDRKYFLAVPQMLPGNDAELRTYHLTY